MPSFAIQPNMSSAGFLQFPPNVRLLKAIKNASTEIYELQLVINFHFHMVDTGKKASLDHIESQDRKVQQEPLLHLSWEETRLNSPVKRKFKSCDLDI